MHILIVNIIINIINNNSYLMYIVYAHQQGIPECISVIAPVISVIKFIWKQA